MDLFLKLSAAAILSLVLLLILEKQEKHIAVLLCITVCCLIAAASFEILQPVVKLIQQLQRTAKIENDMLSALLKAAAVTILCEISSAICTEAGYGALGKSLQLAGAGMILYYSIPMVTLLLESVGQMLGGL